MAGPFLDVVLHDLRGLPLRRLPSTEPCGAALNSSPILEYLDMAFLCRVTLGQVKRRSPTQKMPLMNTEKLRIPCTCINRYASRSFWQ